MRMILSMDPFEIVDDYDVIFLNGLTMNGLHRILVMLVLGCCILVAMFTLFKGLFYHDKEFLKQKITKALVVAFLTGCSTLIVGLMWYAAKTFITG